MTTYAPTWHDKRTDETRLIEAALRQGGFDRVDAYRYNPAVILVRVIDPRFEGQDSVERDAQVDPVLRQLPERTQGDILALYTFAPSELEAGSRNYRILKQNADFDAPDPSGL